MKINLYYLVRPYRGGNDSVGRDSDAACVAGPFRCYHDAYEARQDMKQFADQYEIAKQALDLIPE
jgi:hypothetical protein